MVAHADFTTVVALRAKQGEFMALNAWHDVRQVQPLLEFNAASQSDDKRLDRVDRVVRRLHERGRLVMVDASDVGDPPSFAGESRGALGDLADRLSDPLDLLDSPDPVPFIPVVRSDANANQLTWAGRLSAELGAGGALRLRPGRFAALEVEPLLHQFGVDVGELDVLFDLQYVDSVTPRLIDRVVAALDAVSQLGPFRSMSLLSGSVPAALQHTARWEEPRYEEILWRAVVHRGARTVRFGDYGVGHPLATSGFRSTHRTVKYTCADHWLYIRHPLSRAGEEAAARAFKAVCRDLVHSADFCGPDFSWGDQEMSAAAADRGDGLGSTVKPVAFATSHHLAYLESLAAA